MATTTGTTNRAARNTYGNYRANTDLAGQRTQDVKWYQDAVGRLKNRGFERGSDLYNKNAQRIYDIGNKWGLNWKQHLGSDYTPLSTTANAMNTIQAPSGLRSQNAPMFGLLNNDERRQFIRMRQTDPRAALRWMQQKTKGRTPPQTETTPQPTDTTTDTSTDPATNETNPAPTTTSDPESYMSYQSPMTKALLSAMAQGMSTMQAYEPKSFEGSPLYQFQKQKGMADLEKLMAARGLTGSGAEIQGNTDFLAQLNATEAEKQRQYAEANRDRQQNAMEFIAKFDQSEREALRDQWNADLDRQTNISQFEAGRGDRRQELMVNFLNNVLGLQSQNDIARLAQGGMSSQTDLTKALMSAMTQNIMSQIPKGGGGGGGSPPLPPSANMSGLMEILMRYGNNAGDNDFFNSILRAFK